MNKKKRIWNTMKCLIFVMFVMSAIRITGTNVSAATNGSNWYKKVLASENASYNVRCQYNHTVQTKRVYRRDYPYYKVVDLNKDGVKELILHTDLSDPYDENSILLLTYYNKKVKPLLCIGGSYKRGHFYITGKNLAVQTGGSDFYYYAYFTVSNGKLKKVRDMNYQVIKTKIPYRHYFYVNEKRTSETTWKNAVRKYFPSTLKDITFSKIR